LVEKKVEAHSMSFKMFRKIATFLMVLTIVALALPQAVPAKAADVTLTIESWRTDDVALWDKVIAAFEAKNPGIKVKFQPTNPPDYNAALNAKLASGTAGDLMTCRPFDAGAKLYKDGYLADLSGLPGLEHFNTFAKSAWTTDDGKVTYCLPMASVLHGFIYNKDYFDANKFTEPKTYEEFLTLLEAIKKEGSMAPLAMGTKEGWTTTSMGSDNIGPNFWGGDQGRLDLIAGKRKANDEGFMAAWEALAKWGPYLPEGHEAISYTDSQGLFTSGKAAIFPAGSWEIAGFEKDADFKMGAFAAPPPAGAKEASVSDEIDIAMGANAKSAHLEEAKKFLEFMASEEFATMYSQSLPGFFSLSDYKIKLDDPLANTFLSWRNNAKSALRLSYQKLQGNTDLSIENELWEMTPKLLQGKLTPKEFGDRLQSDLEKYYPAAK